MNELADKVAIITGGGYGIGKQIALKYGAAGAKIVIAARSVEPMKQTCAELERLGVRRVSVGSGPMRASMGLTQRIAKELKEHGTFASMTDGAMPYKEANELFMK